MADISLINIEKYFGSLCVIRKMNLEVRQGEFMVLLGVHQNWVCKVW